MTKQEEKNEELRNVLKEKVKTVFSEITTDFEYERPRITLPVSKLKVTSCSVGAYIEVWSSNKIDCCVYLACDGSNWALNKIDSYRKRLESIDELDAYINSEQFVEDLKSSDVWNYCTNAEYRQYKIDEHTKEELTQFERNFMVILENVGAKEIMRILSPLNQIITYGGDFEAVHRFVSTISNVMEENRCLKLNQFNINRNNKKEKQKKQTIEEVVKYIDDNLLALVVDYKGHYLQMVEVVKKQIKEILKKQ